MAHRNLLGLPRRGRQNISTKYNRNLRDDVWEDAKNRWISLWVDVAPFEDLLSEYKLVSKLNTLYCALATVRLYEATDYNCFDNVSSGVKSLIGEIIKGSKDKYNQ